MRILQTPPRLYPYIGGVEEVVLSLSRALMALGHEVTVLCADEPAGGPEQVEGINIRRLPYAAKVANTNITHSLPLQLLSEQFDVVHTHLPTPWSADWSVLVGRMRGRGVVLSYYNDIVGTGVASLVAGAYNALVLPLTLRLAHRVVVNAVPSRRSFGSPLRAVRGRVQLIPNGVDTVRFVPKPELRTPGTIGFLAVLDEFHRYKGLDVLLRAARQLVERGVEVQLSVGGDGTLRAEYERMAQSLGLAGHVTFHGLLSDAERLKFFNQCQLFVLPSTDARREGFGLVVLEAMACGVPVVLTSAAGVARALSATDGVIIVPAGEVEAMASAIEGVLADRDRGTVRGDQARRTVESSFSWLAIARQYEQLYLALIQASPPERRR